MKLNVVMLCDFYDPELGYQESVLHKSFLSRGHSCSVICAPEMNIFDYYQGKKASHAKTQSVVNIHRCNYLFRFRSLKLLRGIRSKLEELKPNLLFVHDINFSLLVAMLYVRKNPDCVLICDNHCDESNSAKSLISKLIIYKLIKRCIVWITSPVVKKFYGVTPSCIEFMTRMLGVPVRKTQLLPLCVDSIDYGEGLSSEKIKELRLSLDIPSDHFVIFTGGN
jgi:1,2-diacylglycerol 3-alpha-glucosyltransferase